MHHHSAVQLLFLCTSEELLMLHPSGFPNKIYAHYQSAHMVHDCSWLYSETEYTLLEDTEDRIYIELTLKTTWHRKQGLSLVLRV